MVFNNILEFALQALICKANPKNEILGKTACNKLVFLLYHELLKHDLDIKLPYVWYKYGVMIDYLSLEKSISSSSTDYFPFPDSGLHPTQYIREPNSHLVDDLEARLIIQCVDKVLSNYHETDYLNQNIPEKITRDSYEYSPNLFVKIINRDLYPFIRNLKNSRNTYSEEEREIILNILDSLNNDFPRADFDKRVYRAFLKWEDTIQLGMELDSRETVVGIIYDLWEFWYSLFRIYYCKNIYQEFREGWVNEFTLIRFPKYLNLIEETRNYLLLLNEEQVIIDPIIKKTMTISNHLAISR